MNVYSVDLTNPLFVSIFTEPTKNIDCPLVDPVYEKAFSVKGL